MLSAMSEVKTENSQHFCEVQSYKRTFKRMDPVQASRDNNCDFYNYFSSSVFKNPIYISTL